MATITFHHSDGNTDVLEVDPGTTVMRAALANNVRGIVGECGGQAMCATCHVYVREPFLAGLPDISEDEDEMLDFTADPRDETRSRLGCQITLGGGCGDLAVDVPGSQV